MGGIVATWASGVITSGLRLLSSGDVGGVSSGASAWAASGATGAARLGGITATWVGVINSGASSLAASGARQCYAAAGVISSGGRGAAAEALLRLGDLSSYLSTHLSGLLPRLDGWISPLLLRLRGYQRAVYVWLLEAARSLLEARPA